ncbi:DNA/RNA helicase, partial [gut metagenome]
EDVIDKATELLAKAGGPMDLEEVVDEGERDAMADREAALAKELAAMRKRKGKLVDPLQFAVSIGSEDLTGYVPEFAWERERPRQGDLEQLERAGINPDGITTRWQAEKLLGEIYRRRSEGMATPKQVRML